MRPGIRRRWKKVELEIARLLGGERVPVSGRARGWAPDVRHPFLTIEVKSLKHLPIYLANMMDQAVKAQMWHKRRGEGDRLPIGIIHGTGMHFNNALVVMRLSDFRDYFGDSLGNERLQESE